MSFFKGIKVRFMTLSNPIPRVNSRRPRRVRAAGAALVLDNNPLCRSS